MIRTSLVAILAVSFGGEIARAALPHWQRRPQAPYPSDTYAPEMRHYVVVDPVAAGSPAPSKHALANKTPPAGQVLWRQKVEAVPTYPWGWFGARRHLQNLQHTRQYNDARDWSYMRGD
ncbi:MAG TPA: hypothetical protein VG125_27960 [Pirellulales bacterium]|nr:hypothetical protein [Pirellulales bacterium]